MYDSTLKHKNINRPNDTVGHECKDLTVDKKGLVLMETIFCKRLVLFVHEIG